MGCPSPTHNSMASEQTLPRPAVKVFVATTVMLTFISFWRAAAIVLSDLASSAYYVGGDAEKVIGKSAPWFVLAVMLFSYAVRALYIESSSRVCARWGLSRGEAGHGWDPGQAFSLGAVVRLCPDRSHQLRRRRTVSRPGSWPTPCTTWGTSTHRIPENLFSACFAVLVTIYFWWQNIQGIHESSERAMQIMKITTVMVVMLIVWCLITIAKTGAHLPPLPSADAIPRDKEALGWLLEPGRPAFL